MVDDNSSSEEDDILDLTIVTAVVGALQNIVSDQAGAQNPRSTLHIRTRRSFSEVTGPLKK